MAELPEISTDRDPTAIVTWRCKKPGCTATGREQRRYAVFSLIAHYDQCDPARANLIREQVAA